ncbi:MAG: autotransporter assembly complex protein TamA [Luteimonas sp.]
MLCVPRLLLIAVLAIPVPGFAAKVDRVDIVGLDEAMAANVRTSLSLTDAIGKDVPGRRLGYLVRTAQDETREALEPFGLYSPDIAIERTRGGDATVVTITVKPGVPIKVRDADIAILGEGGGDRYLKQDLGAFTPRSGDVFNHALYEASKLRITRRLSERGYFDSEQTARRVEVTRAANAADIELVWHSGDRYDMGTTTFTQQPTPIIRDGVLDKLVYWKPGQYYHQGRLDRLRKSLVALDYFSRIDIQAHPEDAVDQQVPIDVTLTPAKRSIYTAGLSYGTESGAGIRLGVERRYVNDRGHKALAQLDYAQNRKSLTLQYRIPAFAWLDGWYTASLQAVDERSDYIDDRRIEFVGSRSGQFNRNLNLVASIHALRERYAFVPVDLAPGAPVPYAYATYTYPELRAEYIDVDDRIFPRRGIGGSLSLGGGVEGVGSDSSFAQLRARATWFKSVGDNHRLIVRGELGHTFTGQTVDLPPSLRYYAGGDRSIRGYEYREVGPRIPAIPGRGAYSLGAKSLLTTSIEFERYFTPTIGAAVFVDSGDAFDGGSPELRTGVGIGARYRSPVGPIKLDLARGLDDPDSGFTVGLSIGADF